MKEISKNGLIAFLEYGLEYVFWRFGLFRWKDNEVDVDFFLNVFCVLVLGNIFFLLLE